MYTSNPCGGCGCGGRCGPRGLGAVMDWDAQSDADPYGGGMRRIGPGSLNGGSGGGSGGSGGGVTFDRDYVTEYVDQEASEAAARAEARCRELRLNFDPMTGRCEDRPPPPDCPPPLALPGHEPIPYYPKWYLNYYSDRFAWACDHLPRPPECPPGQLPMWSWAPFGGADAKWMCTDDPAESYGTCDDGTAPTWEPMSGRYVCAGGAPPNPPDEFVATDQERRPDILEAAVVTDAARVDTERGFGIMDVLLGFVIAAALSPGA